MTNVLEGVPVRAARRRAPRLVLAVAAVGLAAVACSQAGADARPFDKASAPARAGDGSCYVVKQHDTGFQVTGWTEPAPCPAS